MQVTFRELADGTGRLEVTYKAGKHFAKECVPGIPIFILAAVLISLYSDKDDNARTNLLPVNMAQVRFLAVACLQRCVTLGGICAPHQTL
jgi:hypothetical protein